MKINKETGKHRCPSRGTNCLLTKTKFIVGVCLLTAIIVFFCSFVYVQTDDENINIKPVNVEVEELDLSIPQFEDKDFGGDGPSVDRPNFVEVNSSKSDEKVATKKQNTSSVKQNSKPKKAAAKPQNTKTVSNISTSSENSNSSDRCNSSENGTSNKEITNNVKYLVAQQVWDQLKSYGYSDYVCAGIIGNMMQECGGRTLNLNPKSSGGLCGWIGNRYTKMKTQYGLSVCGQVKYLNAELTSLGQYYPNTHKGETLADFRKSNSPERAALLFAAYVERCSNAPKYVNNGIISPNLQERQVNARKAYEYFVNK